MSQFGNEETGRGTCTQNENTQQFLGIKATVEEQSQKLKSGTDTLFKGGQPNQGGFLLKSLVKNQALKSVFLRATGYKSSKNEATLTAQTGTHFSTKPETVVA